MIELTTAKVRVLWNPNPRKHPILWWRTRHARRFIRNQPPLEPGERIALDTVERTFLFGEGSTDASGE